MDGQRHGRHARAVLGLTTSLLLLAPGVATALDRARPLGQYQYRAWLTEDGLPQGSVEDVLQTEDGYLWFGTQEGLVRFDGVRFEVYDSRNTPTIDNDRFMDLLQALDGALWLGTNGGLLRYRDGQFKAFTEVEGLEQAIIHALAESKTGDIWIGTEQGLVRFSDGSFRIFGAADGLPPDQIHALLVDAQDTLWIGTRGSGIVQWVDGRFVVPPLGEDVADSMVSSLYEDREGAVWIGTQDTGVIRVAEDGIQRFDTDDGLPTMFVTTAYQDRDLGMWIGTYGGGICRLESGRFDCLSTDDGLTHDHITSIHEDREGSLWFGTGGGGLNRLRDTSFAGFTTPDEHSNRSVWVTREGQHGVWVGTESGLDLIVDGHFVDYPGRAETVADSLMAIHEDADGTVWTGLYGGGLRRLRNGVWTTYTTMDGLADNQVFCITRDRAGSLWLATRTGLSRFADDQFTTFTVADGLPSEHVRVLHIDRNGVLWLGTWGGGIATYSNGEIAPFVHNAQLTANQKTIQSIHEDPQGTLWFGTLGGLIRHTASGTDVYTVEDGLHDNMAFSILQDDAGYLWMSSNRGVQRVSLHDLVAFSQSGIDTIPVATFGQDDGMPATECAGGSQPAGVRPRDGRLWFATAVGVATGDPANLLAYPPPPCSSSAFSSTVGRWTTRTESNWRPAPGGWSCASPARPSSLHSASVSVRSWRVSTRYGRMRTRRGWPTT